MSKTVRKYLQYHGIANYSARKKQVVEYKKRSCAYHYYAKEIIKSLVGREPPFVIGFHFVRDSKRKFDFVNAVQIIADLFVAFKVIEDDNMDYLIPVPQRLVGKWYSVDKENPGVHIYIKE